MKTERKWKFLKRAATLLLCCFVVQSLRAELTVTVTPGHVFSDGEAPTVDSLNALGEPSIGIAGTLDGTVGLAAATVSGTHLADSVPDGTNLMFNASSPRQLTIKNITTNNMPTNLFGIGLSGGLNAKVRVNVDTNTVTVDGSNQLAVNMTNLFSGTQWHVDGAQVTLTNFASTNITVPSSSQMFTNAHSLGTTPSFVRAVLVCTSAEKGYAVGDELASDAIQNANSTPCVSVGANATSIFLFVMGDTLQVPNRTSGSGYTSITKASWKFRLYAKP